MQQADLLLLVIDDHSEADVLAQRQQLTPLCPQQLTVFNKIDLSGHAPGWVDDSVYVSAKSGAGIKQLKRCIKQCLSYEGDDQGVFIARRRHLDALNQATQHLQHACTQLERFHAGELMAEDLRSAHQALAEITGEFTSEDLLERIFSTFCIGK